MIADTFEDQITFFYWLRRTRFPSFPIVKTPQRSVIGLFLFATHAAVSGLFLYHIPRYLFFEFPREKKPSSRLGDAEIKVSPSLRGSFGVIKSAANEDFSKYKRNNNQNVKKGRLFIIVSWLKNGAELISYCSLLLIAIVRRPCHFSFLKFLIGLLSH